MNISPGIIGPSPRSADRLVHGYELRPIRERRFDLNVVDHLGNAVHHLRASENMRAGLHQFGYGFAVARTFEDEIGDQRDRLRMVELDATFEAAPSDDGSHRNQELVLLPGGKIHVSPSIQPEPR